MIIPEPVSLSQGSMMMLVDFPDDFEATGKADVSGTVTITTDTVPLGYYWRVERLTTMVSASAGGAPVSTTPAGAALAVYKTSDGNPRPIRYRDGSLAPGLDVADEQPPITVQGGSCLVFQWTGLTVNTYASVSMQYAYLKRVDGSG